MQHHNVADWAQTISAAATAALSAEGFERTQRPFVDRGNLCRIFLYDEHDCVLDARIVRVSSQTEIDDETRAMVMTNPRGRTISVWQHGRCIELRTVRPS